MANAPLAMLIPIPDKMTLRENLDLRRHHIGKACHLHYERVPLRIVRAYMQYMYDDIGNQYLDCINNSAHVGHCQSNVVKAGQQQLATLLTSPGFLSDDVTLYAKRLAETLPDKLTTCYFVNSGSEANDLAIRLARAYTKNKDIVMMEDGFHGSLTTLNEVSSRTMKKYNLQKKNYVHMVPCPNMYRGKYSNLKKQEATQNYIQDAREVMKSALNSGRQIAAFISEPIASQAGVIIPPPGYLKAVYQTVREAGGLCIADEVQVGLGRTGNYWSFTTQDVVPDIVTCGKPLGNGYPMAVVITTDEISKELPFFQSSLAGSALACSMGLAVLDSLEHEKMLSSALCVGRFLMNEFNTIEPRHPMIGDVRGLGLVVGVEIVTDKQSKIPEKDSAEFLCYKLKQAKILLANEGPDGNILLLTPPMCFNIDDARKVVEAVDKYLTEIEMSRCPDLLQEARGGQCPDVELTALHIPRDVIHSMDSDDSSGNDSDEPNYKRMRKDNYDAPD